MKKINVNFKSSQGQILHGILEMPSHKKPHNYILFAHCFTCNKNFHAPTNISSSLASSGFGILRFDFTGLGESEGEFADTNFSGNVEDIIAAAQYLKENYTAPTILIGHSLGGAAVLFASKKIPLVKCIVTINAPSNLKHVQKHFGNNIEEIKKQGYSNVSIGGRDFKIKEQFIKDLKANENNDALNNIKIALLIMHAPGDAIVSISHAEQLYLAAKHPKSFISLDKSDHMLSKEKDSKYAGNVIAAWAQNYIEIPETEELEIDHDVVANLGEKGFTTQITSGKHHFLADEPKSFGGNDLGPNPYEFVSSGLAACTSMTIQMYARRKKWILQNVETKVSYSKKHSLDCENCEDNSAKIDTFEREIFIDAKLDDIQTKKLLEIADKCPVHKTLSSKAHIITKLKND